MTFNFIHNLIIGDEAHFHLYGHVNKQNMRFWGMKNPQIAHPSELQIKLHSTVQQILLQHKRFADFYAQALTLISNPTQTPSPTLSKTTKIT